MTGAGAGIGRAIAESFAAAGAAVMDSDLKDDTARTVAQAITDRGGQTAACDVSREEELAALVRGTVERFGKLTTLVANAGRRRAQALRHALGRFPPRL